MKAIYHRGIKVKNVGKKQSYGGPTTGRDISLVQDDKKCDFDFMKKRKTMHGHDIKETVSAKRRSRNLNLNLDERQVHCNHSIALHFKI